MNQSDEYTEGISRSFFAPLSVATAIAGFIVGLYLYPVPPTENIMPAVIVFLSVFFIGSIAILGVKDHYDTN